MKGGFTVYSGRELDQKGLGRGHNVPLNAIRRGWNRVDQSQRQKSLSTFVRHTRFEVSVRWGVVDLLNAG